MFYNYEVTFCYAIYSLNHGNWKNGWPGEDFFVCLCLFIRFAQIVRKPRSAMIIWPFLFCFSFETGPRANFFELFAKVFRSFRHRGHLFDGPTIFQILAGTGAIRLVQKLSKSEPSSRFFGHLKFRESLPGYRVI